MANDASTHTGYPRSVVEATLDSLLPSRSARKLIGLSGLQGSGKTTFARQLSAAAAAREVRCEVLSLDDFYLARRDRQRLAREVHPLLGARGVPGTHDVGLLERTLAALAHASARQPVRVPRFDKGRDTRVSPSHWRRVKVTPDVIVLEGWCVGVPAQPPGALRRPINALERNEDADGRWRRWVNAQLAGPYAQLWKMLDALVVLDAPGFDVVMRWRSEQERAVRARHAPHAMDARALKRFLMYYERLSRVALRRLPARADLRIALRADRSVRMMECAARWRACVIGTRRADGSGLFGS